MRKTMWKLIGCFLTVSLLIAMASSALAIGAAAQSAGENNDESAAQTTSESATQERQESESVVLPGTESIVSGVHLENDAIVYNDDHQEIGHIVTADEGDFGMAYVPDGGEERRVADITVPAEAEGTSTFRSGHDDAIQIRVQLLGEDGVSQAGWVDIKSMSNFARVIFEYEEHYVTAVRNASQAEEDLKEDKEQLESYTADYVAAFTQGFEKGLAQRRTGSNDAWEIAGLEDSPGLAAGYHAGVAAGRDLPDELFQKEAVFTETVQMVAPIAQVFLLLCIVVLLVIVVVGNATHRQRTSAGFSAIQSSMSGSLKSASEQVGPMNDKLDRIVQTLPEIPQIKDAVFEINKRMPGPILPPPPPEPDWKEFLDLANGIVNIGSPMWEQRMGDGGYAMTMLREDSVNQRLERVESAPAWKLAVAKIDSPQRGTASPLFCLIPTGNDYNLSNPNFSLYFDRETGASIPADRTYQIKEPAILEPLGDYYRIIKKGLIALR